MRLWHTLRHLRPVQFYGRAWFRLVRPRPDLRPAPLLRSTHARWRGCARAPSLTGPATFRFLGVERTLANRVDWNRPDWPKLWQYNAHYFDDLASSGAASRAAWHQTLIARWIDENPPAHGNGWEPYPTSLRIVNWSKWAWAGNARDVRAQHSLAVQARFLCQRIEFHLLGNHLLANAKALIFAGAVFAGEEADLWRERGLKLVRHELEQQILADGGHFERSPMYHAIVLEDLLDLVQLADFIYPGLFASTDVENWRRIATRMLRWLRVMSHPDGGIALFNDAAFDVAPDVAALHRYAVSLGVAADDAPLASVEPLRDSGYLRLEIGNAVLIADVGRIGPDYQPGHAHADTLSFELSLCGRRVLVNGGTSTYEINAERSRQRGTAMHNTVEVDGEDSSEVWHGFRVARRAMPIDVRWGSADGTLWIEASHDGYRRLPGKVVHRRRWELEAQQLIVTDTLTGKCREANAWFRLRPGLSAAPNRDGAGAGAVTEDGQPVLRWQASDFAASAVTVGTWHPRFGASESCQVLAFSCVGATLQTKFFWG